MAMRETAQAERSGRDDLAAAAGTIARRLGRDLPDGGEPREARRDALLERALLYAARIERELADAERRLAHLRNLSMTDELTGLLNRRGLLAEGRRIFAAARRYGLEGAVVYADLDDFKSVNDRFGHQAGDRLLRRVGEILAASVRASDAVGRLGGDEFALVLVQASAGAARQRANALRLQLENTSVVCDGRVVPVRASLGIQPYRPGDRIDEVFRRADAAMYAVKRSRSREIQKAA
jgi:diguanylate cyclase (GGDEF)-like protein